MQALQLRLLGLGPVTGASALLIHSVLKAQGHPGSAAKTARIRPCYGSLGTVDSFSVEGTRPSRFCSQGCSFRSGSLVAELGRQAEAAKEEAEQGAAFLVSGRAWRGG